MLPAGLAAPAERAWRPAAPRVQALRAVDGLCDTCASATDPTGNYFTVVLPVSACGR